MSNVTAFIGRDYGYGEHTIEHVITTVNKAMQHNKIYGATFSQAIGIWQGETEKSIRVEFLNVDEHAAHMTLKTVCRALMQWEIIYTVNGIKNVTIKDNAEKRRAARMNRAA